MVIFKGSMTASSVLLNQTVRVPTMFSLVNFSPDQSLPHQTGLKSTILLYPPHLENWLKGRTQPHILLPLPFPSLPGSPRERKSKRE